MPATVSPLRYPGGKTQLYSYVCELITHNEFQSRTYVEPFAGGAGLALKLLFNNMVSRIVINDSDPAIYAMWHSCLYNPQGLISLVKSAVLSVEEWDKQKAIYNDQNNRDLLQLGFSTLYLNRTNISGIIRGGVLGGRDQKGSSKMDARFNKDTLSKKIEIISQHKERISLSNEDASDLIRNLDDEESIFLNIDPPYVNKGSQLYRNYFNSSDHKSLAELISHSRHPWIVTYDECELVRTLYRPFRCSKLDVRYSANIKRSANELIFFSDVLKLPDSITLLLGEQ